MKLAYLFRRGPNEGPPAARRRPNRWYAEKLKFPTWGTNRDSHRVINGRGFTLVETISYMAIFSMFMVGLVTFFWQIQQSQVKASLNNEVKENMAFVTEQLKYWVRNANEVEVANSTFDTHPGVLHLDYDDGDRIFKTATQQVTVAGQPQNIRTLQLEHVGTATYDLSSERIDVDQFLLTNLTQTGAAVVEIDLDLSNLNPGNDPLYDHNIADSLTVVVREEI